MKLKYIRSSAVRQYARERGRRVGRDFLTVLDDFVHAKIESGCDLHNGGRKTLNAHVAAFVGLAVDHRQTTSNRLSRARGGPIAHGR